MIKSLYSKNCGTTAYNCPPPKPPSGNTSLSKQRVSPCPQRGPNSRTNKSPMEICKEKKKYQRKCGRPSDDCYDIKLAMPPAPGAFLPRLLCPASAGDTGSQIFHLCDNEVISLANTCGEITLSRQCLDEEDENYESLKSATKAEKDKKKEEKKRGKERFKKCKRSAKQILKKYKDREKMRAANEKDYYKRCLKQEQQKVKAAKQRYKEKKKIAKQKMKQNKKKNKERLKKLKQRLDQRCKEMKSRDPNDPKTDSDSADSMECEDPMDLINNDRFSKLPCDGDPTCISLTQMMGGKPIYGCRLPDQVCVRPPTHNNQPTSCQSKQPIGAPYTAPCRGQ